MDAEQRERIFAQALQDYRAGRLATATKSIGRLVQEGSRDPSHISYYGLLLAFTHGRNKQSISSCEEAVERDGRRCSVFYLNLARALAAQGRRREAIVALERGLLVHQSDRRLRRELQHLVPQGKPLIPSLGPSASASLGRLALGLFLIHVAKSIPVVSFVAAVLVAL